jgi:hypothetical protein
MLNVQAACSLTALGLLWLEPSSTRGFFVGDPA